MSKKLCTELMSRIEDFKTNEDFNEHVYMELTQDLANIYKLIEDEEYVTLYFIDGNMRFEDDEATTESIPSVKTFKVVDDCMFLSINTKDIFTCISNGIALNRNTLKKIQDDIDNPACKYVANRYIDSTQTISIYKLRYH